MKKEGISFSTQLGFNFLCQKTKDDKQFHSVFTIETDKIDFTGSFEITKNLTIRLEINDFDFSVKEIRSSSIGEIHIKSFQVVVNIMRNFFKHLVNTIMKNGISCGWVLKYFGIDFISLNETVLRFEDRYIVMYSNVSS